MHHCTGYNAPGFTCIRLIGACIPLGISMMVVALCDILLPCEAIETIPRCCQCSVTPCPATGSMIDPKKTVLTNPPNAHKTECALRYDAAIADASAWVAVVITSWIGLSTLLRASACCSLLALALALATAARLSTMDATSLSSCRAPARKAHRAGISW